MAKTPTPENSSQNFETAMQRLEQIVGSIESDELPLEDLIVRYEEGIKLVKVCETKLQAAEQKIELITRNARGEPELTPFEGESRAAEKNLPAAGGDASLF